MWPKRGATLLVPASSLGLQRQTIGLRNSLIPMRSVGATIAKKMIGVVVAAGTIPHSSPRNLHGRPGMKPSVMELTTQAMCTIILVVQKTQPWLLTNGKMNQSNVCHGSDATILAVLLLCHAFSNGILVLIPMVATG
jgi:hypothetical protein